MRYLFLTFSLILCLLSSLNTYADENRNGVVVQLKDGTEVYFGFNKNPIIKFVETDLTISTNTLTSVSISEVSKIHFVQDSQIPTFIEKPTIAPKFYFDGQNVTIWGDKIGKVSVYTLNGVQLQLSFTQSDGHVSFSVASLPPGIYIVKSQVLSFKFIKR